MKIVIAFLSLAFCFGQSTQAGKGFERRYSVVGLDAAKLLKLNAADIKLHTQAPTNEAKAVYDAARADLLAEFDLYNGKCTPDGKRFYRRAELVGNNAVIIDGYEGCKAKSK